MARITTPLSNTEIKAAKPAEKEYTLQDGDGLYLLVKSSGSKIWRFNYSGWLDEPTFTPREPTPR
ncbi:integrase [Pectobacterium odoriferum]|uniref:Integrase n=1 Tax=Pectobacterium odoriferum TaxID=78398 RepID=A0ABD6VKX1_9GAMM|nr:integrase arm-type DNA-binding domain-containing protein [Pectobacterium odoriferum]POD91144.1 integrase [Pectobacterium odoriferum]POE08334.1 integrase [Pectobacterium odoriferum]POE22553.1 integrase [Pectobacterium odoriferum]POE27281.1 integrase [Pectobacterium odoriferum]